MNKFSKVVIKSLHRILLYPCLLAMTLGENTSSEEIVGIMNAKNSTQNEQPKQNENQLKDLFNKQVEKGATNTIKNEGEKKSEHVNIVSGVADIIKKLQGSKVEKSTVEKNATAPVQVQGGINQLTPINPQADYAKIIGAVSPAVVSIVTIQEVEDNFPSIFEDFFGEGSPFDFFGFDDFFGGKKKKKPHRTQKSIGAASGFCVKIIGDKLYIATNYHVVESAKTVAIFFDDQSVNNVINDKEHLITATVHGVDPKSDLAVLEVDINNKNLKGRKVQTISWGSSEDLKIGNLVFAIGNPFGIGISASQGIVSAKGRQLLGDTKSNPMENYIQHTAALNRGNSGGVLINVKGEVVGVNNAIYSPNGGNVGIGFAIPSDTAKPILDSLIQYKRTFRGWLGATIQSIKTQEAINIGILPPSAGNLDALPPYFGVLVNEVANDGPAARAGIKAGDIIILFDGQLLDESNKLPKLVNNHKIKEPATLTVVRRDTTTGTLNQIEIKVDIGDYQDFEKLGKDVDKTPTTDNNSLTKIPGLDIFVGEEVIAPANNSNSEAKKRVVVKKIKRQRENIGIFGNLFNPFEIGDIIEVANSTQINSANQLKDIVTAFQKENPGKEMTFKIARRNGKNVTPVIITTTINKYNPNDKDDDEQYEEDNSRRRFNSQLEEDDQDGDSSGKGVRRFRFYRR